MILIHIKAEINLVANLTEIFIIKMSISDCVVYMAIKVNASCVTSITIQCKRGD